MTNYNPWPLGKLPESSQRPEPKELLRLGYSWTDPRDIVLFFERKIAEYCGSKFAVTTDSCSNAIFLSLKLREVVGGVTIPANTYVSVPMQIYHAGAIPIYEDLKWSGEYQIGETGIWDSAARFTSGMFRGEGVLQCLSFQIKKRLPIGRGGAILTDSENEYHKLKLMSYDGRDLLSPYTDTNHVKTLGWHMYMTPEDAARGLLLLEKTPATNDDTMDESHYPDLREWKLTRELSKRSGEI